MKIRLYSYGGSGLKFLTNITKNYVSEAIDSAHNPHTFEDINRRPIDKAIFIYADPRDAICSFFRRNGKSAAWVRRHFDHMNPNFMGSTIFYDKDRRPKTINEYLDTCNVDEFGLERLFCNWLNYKPKKPLLFVKYESIMNSETLQELQDFLQINNQQFVKDMRDKFRTRASSYKDLEEEYVDKITKMNQSLLEKQENLPNFFISGEN